MKTWKKALSLTAAVAMTATMMPVSAFAADDETFKIGVIGPMTGDNAQWCIPCSTGCSRRNQC